MISEHKFTVSDPFLFLIGGRFNVRGRTGNDNSGILTCADDSSEIQTENTREDVSKGVGKATSKVQRNMFKQAK